ncbi:MAG: glycosyltransferase family 39 protein [Phycisphaerae bacterium]
MNRFWSRPGLLLFGLALALRLAWIQTSWIANGPALAYPDETLHWQLARNLVTRGEMRSDDGRYAARMPLYPLFLAPMAVLGDEIGVWTARIAQAIAGALTVALVARWAAGSLGRTAASVAGILAAIDPFGVFFSNLLLSETPFTLAAVAFAYATWRAACAGRSGARDVGPSHHECNHSREPSRRSDQPGSDSLGSVQPGLDRPGSDRPESDRPGSECCRSDGPALVTHAPCLVALVLLGPTLVLTRQSALGWVMLAWVWLAVRSRSWLIGTRRVLLCGTVLAATMLPWGMRNLSVIGDWAWLSSNSGLTLYDALGPQADGSSDQSFLANMPELATLGEAQRDRELHRLALESLAQDPLRVVRLAGAKLLRTWSLRPNVETHRGGIVATISAAFMIVVLAAALAGVLRRRRDGAWLAALLLPIAYFTLLHCVYVGSVRYRVPVMPMIELLAAGAISAPFRAARAANLSTGIAGN